MENFKIEMFGGEYNRSVYERTGDPADYLHINGRVYRAQTPIELLDGEIVVPYLYDETATTDKTYDKE